MVTRTLKLVLTRDMLLERIIKSIFTPFWRTFLVCAQWKLGICKHYEFLPKRHYLTWGVMHIFCLFAVEKETGHTPIPVSWQSGVKRRRRIRASTTFVCCLRERAKSAGCTPRGTTCRSTGMMTWWRTGAPTTSAPTPSYHAILSSIPTGDKTLNPVYIAVYFKLFYFLYEVLFNRLWYFYCLTFQY